MRDKRAFLLLEVMTSIVIITGGLIFVMRVYATAKAGLVMSRQMFKDSILLEKAAFEFEERGVIEEDRETARFADQKEYFWSSDGRALEPQGQELGDLCSAEFGVYRAPDGGRAASPPRAYSVYTYLDRKK